VPATLPRFPLDIGPVFDAMRQLCGRGLQISESLDSFFVSRQPIPSAAFQPYRPVGRRADI
jgi:hypothetical protein